MSKTLICAMIKIIFSTILVCALSSCEQSASNTYYNQATQLAKQGGSFNQVRRLLDKAVKLEPTNQLFLQGRGTFLFDNGFYSEALVDLSRAAEISGPGQAYCLYLKGLCEGKLSHYSNARSDIQMALKLYPRHDSFYGALAIVYLALEKPDAALQSIDRAMALSPKAGRWQYVRGMVLSCLGKKEAAIEQFNQTVVYTRVGGPDNKQTDIFFDGRREYERVQKCTRDDIAPQWTYGGRWLVDEVYNEYRK